VSATGTQPEGLRWDLANFLLRLAWNLNFPDLLLLSHYA
jgi:hypothetical protein